MLTREALSAIQSWALLLYEAAKARPIDSIVDHASIFVSREDIEPIAAALYEALPECAWEISLHETLGPLTHWCVPGRVWPVFLTLGVALRYQIAKYEPIEEVAA